MENVKHFCSKINIEKDTFVFVFCLTYQFVSFCFWYVFFIFGIVLVFSFVIFVQYMSFSGTGQVSFCRGGGA